MTPQTLLDWPAVVGAAAHLGSNFEEAGHANYQRFVMRAYPKALYERMRGDPSQPTPFVNVLPSYGFVAPSFEENLALIRHRLSWVGYVVDAIATRDAEIEHSMVMQHVVLTNRDQGMYEVRTRYARDEDQSVVEWLRDAKPDAKRLARLTWDQALKAAEEWEAAEDLRNGAIRVESRDGWFWKRLWSRKSLEDEGGSLGHCVGADYVDEAQVPIEEGGLWSLRDADGDRVMTLMMNDTQEGSVYVQDFLGKGNRNAEPTHILHFPALRAFYAERGRKILPEMMTVGSHYGIGSKETLEVDGVTLEAWDETYHDEEGIKVTHHTRQVAKPNAFVRGIIDMMSRNLLGEGPPPGRFRIPAGQVFMRVLDETVQPAGPLQRMGDLANVTLNPEPWADDVSAYLIPERPGGGMYQDIWNSEMFGTVSMMEALRTDLPVVGWDFDHAPVDRIMRFQVDHLYAAERQRHRVQDRFVRFIHDVTGEPIIQADVPEVRVEVRPVRNPHFETLEPPAMNRQQRRAARAGRQGEDCRNVQRSQYEQRSQMHARGARR